jgi:uncharacterized protein (TIGR02217 family)
MSGFIETRFNDTRIIYGTMGGPAWKTAIAQVNSGKELREATWLYPLCSYDFVDRAITEDEAYYIRDFFNAVQGMLIGFRFKDWLDWRDDGNGIVNMTGFGNNTSTGQLFKTYSMGGQKNFRKISKPVLGTVKIFIDGVEATSATVDTTTGVVSLPLVAHTITAASASGVSAALLTVPGHDFQAGDYATFAFTGGAWSSAGGIRTISVIDANTISIPVNASGFGSFATGEIHSFAQARNVLTWTGEFDVPVRFDADAIQMQFMSAQVLVNGYPGSEAVLGMKGFDLKAIRLVELKL